MARTFPTLTRSLLMFPLLALAASLCGCVQAPRAENLGATMPVRTPEQCAVRKAEEQRTGISDLVYVGCPL